MQAEEQVSSELLCTHAGIKHLGDQNVDPGGNAAAGLFLVDGLPRLALGGVKPIQQRKASSMSIGEPSSAFFSANQKARSSLRRSAVFFDSSFRP